MTASKRQAGGWLHGLLVAVALALDLGAAAAGPSHAQPPCPSARETESPINTWLAAPGRHPLVGTILHSSTPLTAAPPDACSPSPVTALRRALTAHLADGGLLLLGEIHDSGVQHALRGYLIDAIAAEMAQQDKPAPALVFEHIRTDQAAAFGEQVKPTSREAARQAARDLLARLDWENSGWPPATLFLPIFEAAIAHRLPILPGHPTRAEVRDVARRGLSALPEGTVKQLGLDTPLPEPFANTLLDELEESHCGLMPRTAFTNMALAQRYRDAHLAARLAAAANQHGAAILLAGNGHVRTDRGVPWDLARLVPERKVLAVAFIEVEDGKNDAAGYVPRDPSGRPAYDYVILTPRTERADPCEAMRAQFKKKG